MANLATAEDDVIKKRLLIEGDSGNDDRLINKLCRNFVTWTHSFYNSGAVSAENAAPGQIVDEDSAEFMNEQIMACLAHVEFGLLRNQFILDMNVSEQQSYEQLYERINDEIERAKSKIVASKGELQEARKIRKNRQEYDILARQILNFPERVEMESTIRELEGRLEGLKRSENELDRKLELRRKQFNAVLHSLSSMKNVIENDTKLDEYLAGRSDEPGGETVKEADANFHDSLLDAKMSRLISDENGERSGGHHRAGGGGGGGSKRGADLDDNDEEGGGTPRPSRGGNDFEMEEV
jgi:THO complex subunit 7